MSKVQISENKECLLRGGSKFFYLADTVWSVFSNATVDEWGEYLDYRKSQNFNSLQISVLPILHDASNTYTGLYPFHLNAEGIWDFYRINEKFFDKAEKMVQMAYDKGFVPVLVVLWNNYVPGTWANTRVAEYTMPKDVVKPFTEYVVKRFSKYNPMYFISGDTKFENEEVNEYFVIALNTLKALDPDALTALHPVGNFHEIPEAFVNSDHLDLYIYQSGHCLEDQHAAYSLAESFMGKSVKRPIINSEPCYEGHGHGNRYGRFQAFDLRKAFWSSVLSGAKAGFTYGAHGVWSWQVKGAEFTSESWSKTPFDWRASLRFQGAWDVGYAKWIFEQYDMFDLIPRQDMLQTPYPDIRVAAASDLSKVVVYAPYSNDVRLQLNLSEYEVTMIDLVNRNIMIPDSSDEVTGFKISMPQSNADTVIIALRKQ